MEKQEKEVGLNQEGTETIQKLIAEIPKGTIEWIESIGGLQNYSPMLYMAMINDTQMHYSLDYLKNTPLEKLKEEHKKNVRTLP